MRKHPNEKDYAKSTQRWVIIGSCFKMPFPPSKSKSQFRPTLPLHQLQQLFADASTRGKGRCREVGDCEREQVLPAKAYLVCHLSPPRNFGHLGLRRSFSICNRHMEKITIM